jgi:hypothetical protein
MNTLFEKFATELYVLRETGDLDHELYEAAFDYYCQNGEMPYGVAKARTGDPYVWITDKLMEGYYA